MTTVENPAVETDDALFHVQRMIAQRADELSRQYGQGRSRDLECWQQAEHEFWDQTGPLIQSHTKRPVRAPATSRRRG